LETWLFETQKLYEQAIQKYIKFRENHIERQIAYDEKIANEIVKLKNENLPVTIIKELAKKESQKEYRELELAESQKKRYTKWIEAFESRINMIKYLMRRKYEDTL
jgi:ferric iron reductase protein FhuF